jgi:hypothetical protein
LAFDRSVEISRPCMTAGTEIRAADRRDGDKSRWSVNSAFLVPFRSGGMRGSLAINGTRIDFHRRYRLRWPCGTLASNAVLIAEYRSDRGNARGQKLQWSKKGGSAVYFNSAESVGGIGTGASV